MTRAQRRRKRKTIAHRPSHFTSAGAVGDDVVLDALVDLAGHYSAIQEVVLGVVGPEAHDANGPTARHSRHLEQFVNGRVIEIHTRLRRWNRMLLGELKDSASGGFRGARQKCEKQACCHRRDSHCGPHSSIVCLEESTSKREQMVKRRQLVFFTSH